MGSDTQQQFIQPGQVNFQISATTSDFNIGGATATARIEGSPEIVFLNTFDRVEIDNASTRPIRINNVGVRNPLPSLLRM